MKKFVKVPIKTYLQLVNDSNQLYYLNCCGVDNWEPGISKREFEEENDFSFANNESNIEFDIIEE